MSRKPSPPISYGDEVALPGLAALKPSAGETAPPQDDPDHMGDHGRGGRRPIWTRARRHSSTFTRPRSTSYGSTLSPKV